MEAVTELRPKIAIALWVSALSLFADGLADAQPVEAESGAILGSASVYSDGSASGGRGVAYISSADAGFRLPNVPAASGVDIRYASEFSGSITIFVDGTFAGSVEFPSTGAWVGDYGFAFFPIEIPAGADFEMMFTRGDAAINVDFVDFIPPTSHVVEAESGMILGAASIYLDVAASGGQGVAYIHSPGSGFRIPESPAASGVDIRYASERSGSLSVFVNGGFVGTVEFLSTGSWVGNYGLISFAEEIPAGADFEVVFQNGDTAMNVDFVDFLAPTPGPSSARLELEPEPSPEPETSFAVFGIDPSGNVFHVDEGWSASFNYLCVNGDCFPGTRSGGFFRRDASAEVEIGQTVGIQFKVEDHGGQCLTGEVIVTRQPGLTLANSPCAIGSANSFPAPRVIPDTDIDPDLVPADLGPSDRDGLGAGLISFDGDTITTRLAERFRARHESDRNHDTYIDEYAQGSTYEIVLIDRPDSLEVQIHSPQAPLSMVNFTHDHIMNSGFSDPPQYRGGGFMAKGSLDGPANDDPDQLVNHLYFDLRHTNGRPWSEVRHDQEIVTLEFTPRRELNGTFPQYYSDIVRYRAGQGGITFERDDPRYFSAGPTTNFAHGSPGFEFSQPFLGIDQPSLHAFTLGRELFRASFLGDPLPGNGGNASGADSDAAASACVDCHFQLGKAAPPDRSSEEQQGFIHGGSDLRVAPSLIGLGLLEAVAPSTIEKLAQDSGGKIPDGRFGWKATEPTIRSQILKAFELDLGVRDVSQPFVDHIEQYIRGVGVPIRRHPAAQASQEPNVGLRVADTRAITDAEVLDGEAAFMESGCASCHVPALQTGDHHPVPQFRNITIRPFTDLLLWNMGPELCADSDDGGGDRCEWRTAPLWGIRLQEQVTGHATFLHDGRASSLDEAIRLHGGDAQAARDAYSNLSATRRSNFLLYLMSL